MASTGGFQTLVHGHRDLVLAVDFNFYGDRMVTASSDHHLKVWSKKGDAWELVDSWRGHDAEITDVKWNGPFTGTHLGSIGQDGLFKLWTEDITVPPLSNKRFRSIMQPPLASKSPLPWSSLDFKNADTETYLALITRDGNFSVFEPKDHDDLAGEWVDWMAAGDVWVRGSSGVAPSRAEETSFRVAWHREKMPCWSAVGAGLDRRALSIAVAAMDTVKVYRTDGERRLYVAAELTGASDLVRDVAWANGSMRGWDVIATAGKDGLVRIYDVKTPTASQTGSNERGTVRRRRSGKSREEAQGKSQNDAGGSQRTVRNKPSGIGAGLAGAQQRANVGPQEETGDPTRVKHSVELVAELTEHRAAVWRVAFSFMGDILTSTGDDGAVRTWKKGINGKWFEYAEIDVKSLH